MNQEIRDHEDPTPRSKVPCPLYFDHIKCPLCSELVMQPCVECRTEGPAAKERCLTVIGVCNHAFHYHCISSWLVAHNKCPVDNSDWFIQWYGY